MIYFTVLSGGSWAHWRTSPTWFNSLSGSSSLEFQVNRYGVLRGCVHLPRISFGRKFFWGSNNQALIVIWPEVGYQAIKWSQAISFMWCKYPRVDFWKWRYRMTWGHRSQFLFWRTRSAAYLLVPEVAKWGFVLNHYQKRKKNAGMRSEFGICHLDAGWFNWLYGYQMSYGGRFTWRICFPKMGIGAGELMTGISSYGQLS